MGGLLFAQGRGLGGSGPCLEEGGSWCNGQASLPGAAGLGLAGPWVGLARSLGLLGALPHSLLFPLTSCFLFLLVLTAYCHLLPSPPAQSGCVGRRLVFRSKGGVWGGSVYRVAGEEGRPQVKRDMRRTGFGICFESGAASIG